jgi:hypothetical protein
MTMNQEGFRKNRSRLIGILSQNLCKGVEVNSEKPKYGYPMPSSKFEQRIYKIQGYIFIFKQALFSALVVGITEFPY